MKKPLAAALLLVAAIAAADERSMSVWEVLHAGPSLHGRTITVEASIHDHHHGMFLQDLVDDRKLLGLYLESNTAESDVTMKMTEMLLDDRGLDEPLGVVADLTGRFTWVPDGLSLLSVSKIKNLRWGKSEEEWECRIEPDSDAFEVVVLSDVKVTSRLTGTVLPFEGDWFGGEAPRLRVWRHAGGKPAQVDIAKDGTIGEVSLLEDRYCFAASARGFNTVIGRLDIRYTSPERPVEILMGLAN
jgi:hypothetical protein